jgi:hypothetical protein
MSSPQPSQRTMVQHLLGEDFVTKYLILQRDVEVLKRDRGLAGKSLSWNVVTPVVPATTVAEVNTNSKAVTVYIRGGTVTNITVAGVALGMTSGSFRVNPGDDISITYSVTPTWFWYGD